MCRLAVAGDAFFEVDPIEIERSGPSFTIDTASAFQARGEAEVHWALGTDHVARLHTWHRFDELIRTVRFTLMRRAGEPFHRDGLDARVQTIVDQIVEVPQIEVSATQIRNRVQEGKSIEHLVPPGVARWIANRHLYQ